MGMSEADIVVALMGGDFTEEEIQIKCDISQDDINAIMEGHNCEICANCQIWSNADDIDEDGFCEECQELWENCLLEV